MTRLTSSHYKWVLSSSDSSSGIVDLPVPHLPITVHEVLWDHEIIEHPYGGCDDREKKQYWISLTEAWTFEMDRSCPLVILARDAADAVLCCAGIDTLADLFLFVRYNSPSSEGRAEEERVHIGSTENMFRRYLFHLGSNEAYRRALQPLQNVDEAQIEIRLQIVIKSPVHGSRELSNKYDPGYVIPCPPFIHTVDTTHRNFIRKAGMDFGWDWGFAAMSSGILKPIDLIAEVNPLLLEDVTVSQNEHDIVGEICRSVHLRIVLHINKKMSSSPGGDIPMMKVILRDDENTLIRERTVAIDSNESGQFHQEIQFELENMKLWWPLDYGAQNLYRLEVRLLYCSDTPFTVKRLTIGIRKFQLDQSVDQIGNRFLFVVNDVPVYCKGANWIPADTFQTRVDSRHLKSLLSSACRAHMNTLRVWGGGVYEQDIFYELCDEMGIMIWQDFMFACSLYPAHEEFLDNVRHEVQDQVRRLQHHACIVIWAGNNENEAALYSWPECQDHKEQLEHSYNRLYYDVVYQQLMKDDSKRPFIPSSPTNGFRKGGNPGDLTRGDSHYWEVWHGGKPFSTYQSITPRFCSEFGFQSIPNVTILEPYITHHSIHDEMFNSGAMEYRQRSFATGNKTLMEHIHRELPMPASFARTVYYSQVNQANAIRIAVEHWRRNKHICSGALFWQLNDSWVGNSWSSIQWNGQWKLLHYQARHFFAPILLSVRETSERLDVWLTNDLRTTAISRATLTVELRQYVSGKILERWEIQDIQQESNGSGIVLSMEKKKLFRPMKPEKDPNDYAFYKALADGDATDSRYLREDCFLVCSLENIGLQQSLDEIPKLTCEGHYRVIHHFVKLKEANLATDTPPSLKIEIDTASDETRFNIILESDVTLFHISLEMKNDQETIQSYRTTIDRVVHPAGYFDDSNFSLFPGERRKLTFVSNRSKVDNFMERLSVETIPNKNVITD